MVMRQQVGAPGVQDREESDLCAEPFGIGGHLEQGPGTGIEQQVEESLGVVSASGFSSCGTVKTTWK
jgi:hypothetical protein